jgi:hypothetical protein
MDNQAQDKASHWQANWEDAEWDDEDPDDSFQQRLRDEIRKVIEQNQSKK